MEGLIALVIFLADIWAILNVVKSSLTTGKKALWIILILLLPVIGLILFILLGPKKA